MDAGTTLLVCIGVGLLLGAGSSVVTRRIGTWAGIVVGIVAAALGLAVIAMAGELLLPVVASMLAFSVVASLLDPRPKKLLQ